MNKFSKILASLALGVSLTLGIGCNYPNPNHPKDDIPKKELNITSNPVTIASVNSDYSYQLSSGDKEIDCFILDGPSWMNIKENKLQGIPYHIANQETGLDHVEVGCLDNELNYKEQNFDIEVFPGKYERNKDLSYDYIQYIDLFHDYDGDGLDDSTDKDVVLLCETGFCPRIYYEKEGESYTQKKREGIKKSLDLLIETIGNDVFDLVEKPVEIHVVGDSICNEFPGPIATSDNNYPICNYFYDWVENGTSFSGYTNCLDLGYSEVCIDEDRYISPDFVGPNGIEIHEYLHDILLLNSKIEENFTYPIQYILSNNNGFKEINSFRDLDKTIDLPEDMYIFMWDLNDKYRFDIDSDLNNNGISDIIDLFDELFNRYYSGNHTLIFPISNGELKCALDKIIGKNTYYEFWNDVCCDYNNLSELPSCSDSSNLTRAYCSLKKGGANWVDPNYCGD